MALLTFLVEDLALPTLARSIQASTRAPLLMGLLFKILETFSLFIHLFQLYFATSLFYAGILLNCDIEAPRPRDVTVRAVLN